MFSDAPLVRGLNRLSMAVAGGTQTTTEPARVTGVEAILTYASGN